MKAIVVLIIFTFYFSTVSGQESIHTSGGNVRGSGGSASYTIGQLVYQTYTGTNDNSISEGVQQAYEISIISGFEQANGINLSVSVYPNPTADCLTLEVKEFDLASLFYLLFDINGRTLQSGKIEGVETSIHMNNYIPTTYILQIVNKNLKLKEIIIVKN